MTHMLLAGAKCAAARCLLAQGIWAPGGGASRRESVTAGYARQAATRS